MPIAQDVTRTLDQLSLLARGRLTREGLTRLQALTQHLGDLLNQAETALRGRLDLTGDLWPEIEDDDEEEDQDMKQSERERLLLFESGMDNADVPKYTKVDVRTRLENKFAEHDVVEDWEVRDFLASLKKGAGKHLWQQPVSPQKPAEKPFDWSSIANPAERMTRYREHQAQQEEKR